MSKKRPENCVDPRDGRETAKNAKSEKIWICLSVLEAPQQNIIVFKLFCSVLKSSKYDFITILKQIALNECASSEHRIVLIKAFYSLKRIISNWEMHETCKINSFEAPLSRIHLRSFTTQLWEKAALSNKSVVPRQILRCVCEWTALMLRLPSYFDGFWYNGLYSLVSC